MTMFSNSVNFTARSIKEASQKELNNFDEKLLNQLWDCINTVFQQWKLEHGDKNPQKGITRLFKPIPFDEAEPWECAGLLYPSQLALALKLLTEKYPNFIEIFKMNPCKVLALLIMKSIESTNQDDLFNCYTLLIEFQKINIELSVVCENWKSIKSGESTRKNLAKGNPIASKNKSEKANLYHEDWKKWAKETWIANPFWNTDEVAKHVFNYASKYGHKMANGNPYSISTIKQNIKGVKQSLKYQN